MNKRNKNIKDIVNPNQLLSRFNPRGFGALKFLLEKEFKQILRNKFLIRVIIFLPLIALSLLPMVANFEIKNNNLAVIDNDHSPSSSLFIRKIVSSGHFHLVSVRQNYNDALNDIEQDRADVILEIPAFFEKDLMNTYSAQVNVTTNAVNAVKGALGSGYLMQIIHNFSNDLRSRFMAGNSKIQTPAFEIVPRYDFNPYLEYKFSMIPAIIMMILGMISGFLPALNIVGEKEKGTIEQMNVTPVGRFPVILSKLIPYWIIGFIVLTICFIVVWIIYGMVSVGGYLEIYLFATVFVLAFSGLGLIISNYANTIQQAMYLMFFFVINFIFLSGLYTPISSTPEWVQTMSLFSPLRYMIEALRSIYLKGSHFGDLWTKFAALVGFAVFFNLWAILSYRKKA